MLNTTEKKKSYNLFLCVLTSQELDKISVRHDYIPSTKKDDVPSTSFLSLKANLMQLNACTLGRGFSFD